ncbi:hypothetical protein nbrc107696_05570 [Gordonia spumicola]|uniref:Amidohydrolase-related domain-containing protein n=1 Tax=Gordonia spumicola TaxID=589161 RepID=A0A7I9V521_9ACTN|nr:hypothetical protein nbrc107696_05570 [Gordonia spumicola]
MIPGIVDAHVHFYDPMKSTWALSRYARVATMPVINRFPRPALWMSGMLTKKFERLLMIDPSIVRTAYEPRHYGAEAATLHRVAGVGVGSVVHMESHWSGDTSDAASSFDETRYVTGLSFGGGRVPDLGAIVVAADPAHPGFAAAIDAQTGYTPLVRGVRYKWSRHADPQVTQWRRESGVLGSPDFLRGFETLADAGLVFHSFAYSHQLGELDLLARRFPETTIVVEHLGLPVGVFGPVGADTGTTAAARAEILGLWKERIAMLAARPNIVVKVSGLALGVLGYGRETAGTVGGRGVLAEMIGPLVLHVVDRFGPDRVVFGSDMPIDRPNAPLDVVVGALLDVVADRGDYLLGQLFARNAQRIYGIS